MIDYPIVDDAAMETLAMNVEATNCNHHRHRRYSESELSVSTTLSLSLSMTQLSNQTSSSSSSGDENLSNGENLVGAGMSICYDDEEVEEGGATIQAANNHDDDDEEAQHQHYTRSSSHRTVSLKGRKDESKGTFEHYVEYEEQIDQNQARRNSSKNKYEWSAAKASLQMDVVHEGKLVNSLKRKNSTVSFVENNSIPRAMEPEQKFEGSRSAVSIWDDSLVAAPPPPLYRGREISEMSTPGAIAVPGFLGQDNVANDDTTVTVHPDEDGELGGLPTCHATLVHDEEVVLAISAMDITEQESKSKRRQRITCIGGVTIIAILVTIIVAVMLNQGQDQPQSHSPSSSPSSGPTNMLVGLNEIVALDGGFPAETTAQYEALQWLSDNSNSAEYSKEELRQRYSLATLLYSNLKYTNQAPDSLSNKSHCTWSGIECRNEKGAGNMQVIGIHRTLLKPTTDSVLTLPPELALLSNSLQYLQFPNTTLEGTFPSELGRLTELKLLEFSANPDFTQGQLFSEIGRLHQLEKLSLHNCGLTGVLPTEIGLMKNLVFLDLSGNNFASTMPTQIGQLTQLEHFDIQGNQFYNDFPPHVGFLKNLTYFDISNNRIVSRDSNGYLPLELTNLTKLQYLDAAGNGISGFVNFFQCHENNNQACQEFSQLLPPDYSLPSDLGRLTLLTWLDLSDNEIQSNLPVSLLEKLTNLESFILVENSLFGSIPSEFGLLTKLTHADLGENDFTGPPPEDLSKLTPLNFLNLQSNDTAGIINCSMYPNISLQVDCDQLQCSGDCNCSHLDGNLLTYCPAFYSNSTDG